MPLNASIPTPQGHLLLQAEPEAPLLARGVDLELVAREGVVAFVAGVGDDTLEADADLAFEFGKDPGEGMTIVGQPWQSFDIGDELATLQRWIGVRR